MCVDEHSVCIALSRSAHGHVATVRYLLHQGADTKIAVPGNGSRRGSQTPLQVAEACGHSQVVAVLRQEHSATAEAEVSAATSMSELGLTPRRIHSTSALTHEHTSMSESSGAQANDFTTDVMASFHG
eukprot:SAG31_NODE_6167_length_2140_cov_1.499755_2_plen_127_part_01